MIPAVILPSPPREKYDELVAKERDLNNFMDSFPSRRAEKTREAQEKQDGIVALLDKIAKLQGLAGSALPSQKKFKEMQVRVKTGAGARMPRPKRILV